MKKGILRGRAYLSIVLYSVITTKMSNNLSNYLSISNFGEHLLHLSFSKTKFYCQYNLWGFTFFPSRPLIPRECWPWENLCLLHRSRRLLVDVVKHHSYRR